MTSSARPFDVELLISDSKGGSSGRSPARRWRSARRVRAFRPAVEPGGIALEERSLLSVTFNPFSVNVANASPFGLTQVPGGNLWFTLDNGSSQPQTQIGSINPATKQVNIVPLTQAPGQGNLGAIAADSSGNLWFVDVASSLVEEYNPTTQAFHEQSLTNDGGSLGDVVFGPNQAIWVADTGARQIDEVNPQTLAVTPFTVPGGLFPDGLAVGPDGALWFTTHSPTIGRFDPASSQFQTFTVPNGSSTADGITAGPNNLLYFTDPGAAAIGVITPAGSASLIHEVPIPSQFLDIFLGNSGLGHGITSGADGNVWFAMTTSVPEIGSFDPATGAIDVFGATNDKEGRSTAIVLASDGNLWFTDFGGDNVVQAVSSSSGGNGGGGNGTAPTITGAHPLVQTTTGKGKHAHHNGHLAGFTLTFNEALDPAHARDAANYTVLVKVKHGRKTITRPIGITVDYSAGSDAVAVLTGKQAFAKGGELKVNGSAPGGITDLSDAFFLTGTTTFNISPKGRSISP